MTYKQLQQNNLIPRESIALYDFQTKFDKIDNKNGCYAFVDFANDEIVYIGKAYFLKNRLQKYFSVYANSFSYANISSNTELFLLVWYTLYRAELETLLIDQLRPKYNTRRGECNIGLIRRIYRDGIV